MDRTPFEPTNEIFNDKSILEPEATSAGSSGNDVLSALLLQQSKRITAELYIIVWS